MERFRFKFKEKISLVGSDMIIEILRGDMNYRI